MQFNPTSATNATFVIKWEHFSQPSNIRLRIKREDLEHRRFFLHPGQVSSFLISHSTTTTLHDHHLPGPFYQHRHCHCPLIVNISSLLLDVFTATILSLQLHCNCRYHHQLCHHIIITEENKWEQVIFTIIIIIFITIIIAQLEERGHSLVPAEPGLASARPAYCQV